MKPLPILIKLVCWNQHEKLNIKFQQNLRYWVTDWQGLDQLTWKDLCICCWIEV